MGKGARSRAKTARRPPVPVPARAAVAQQLPLVVNTHHSFHPQQSQRTLPPALLVAHHDANSCTSGTRPLHHQPLTDTMKPSETLSLLTRLSQKPGVQSTLVLARDTGAIVHTSGFSSNSATANPNSTLPASTENAASAAPLTNGQKETGMRSAEDVARMVYGFVEAAGELVKNLEEEDEVKLLRLRTKKNELVIVPGMLPSTHPALVNWQLTTAPQTLDS